MCIPVDLGNVAHRLRKLCQIIKRVIRYNAESDTWGWENHEVSEEDFGKAYESLENVVNILERAREFPEEREAGAKLLTRFDIVQKYDIKR